MRKMKVSEEPKKLSVEGIPLSSIQRWSSLPSSRDPRFPHAQETLQGVVRLYPSSPVHPPPIHYYSWAVKKSLFLVAETLQKKGSTWGAVLPNWPAELCWQSQHVLGEVFAEGVMELCQSSFSLVMKATSPSSIYKLWRSHLLPRPWGEGEPPRGYAGFLGLPTPFLFSRISGHHLGHQMGPHGAILPEN